MGEDLGVLRLFKRLKHCLQLGRGKWCISPHLSLRYAVLLHPQPGATAPPKAWKWRGRGQARPGGPTTFVFWNCVWIWDIVSNERKLVGNNGLSCRTQWSLRVSGFATIVETPRDGSRAKDLPLWPHRMDPARFVMLRCMCLLLKHSPIFSNNGSPKFIKPALLLVCYLKLEVSDRFARFCKRLATNKPCLLSLPCCLGTKDISLLFSLFFQFPMSSLTIQHRRDSDGVWKTRGETTGDKHSPRTDDHSRARSGFEVSCVPRSCDLGALGLGFCVSVRSEESKVHLVVVVLVFVNHLLTWSLMICASYRRTLRLGYLPQLYFKDQTLGIGWLKTNPFDSCWSTHLDVFLPFLGVQSYCKIL